MGNSQPCGSNNSFEGHKPVDDDILDIAERPSSIETQGSSGPSTLSGSVEQVRAGREVLIQKSEHLDEVKRRPGFRELFQQPLIQVPPTFNIPWNILRRDVMRRSKARERIIEPRGIVASTFSTSNDYGVVENWKNNLNNEDISHVQLDGDKPRSCEDSPDRSKFTSEDGAFAEGG